MHNAEKKQEYEPYQLSLIFISTQIAVCFGILVHYLRMYNNYTIFNILCYAVDLCIMYTNPQLYNVHS